MAVPRLRWASPAPSAPAPSWLAGTSPAPTNTGRPCGQAPRPGRPPAAGHPATVGGGRDLGQHPERHVQQLAQPRVPRAGVRRGQSIRRRAGPVDDAAARQPGQHGLLAVQQPACPRPRLGCLVPQPVDAGHDVLGRDDAAGGLELLVEGHPSGERRAWGAARWSSQLNIGPIGSPAASTGWRLNIWAVSTMRRYARAG